jgi:hypothetical protein
MVTPVVFVGLCRLADRQQDRALPLIECERVRASVDAGSTTVAMHTFEFFIEDDRYKVPTLELVQVRDADRARQLAAERLRASLHHQSVEVRTGNVRLFFISRREAPRGADDAHRTGL